METRLFYYFLLEEHKSEPNKIKYHKVLMSSLKNRFELLKNLPERLENCSICLDKMDKNSITKTKCEHYFHKKCLYIWKSENAFKTCPLCRNDLLVPSIATFYWDIKESSNKKGENVPLNTHLDLTKKDEENGIIEFCFKIIISGGMGSKGKAEYKIVY